MAKILAMKYILIDKIKNFEAGKEITATKSVSLAEEYLGDHFPTFPVLPGVLLLQGMVETASWLVRASEDFAHSMVILEEAKNVNYKSFADPGTTIEYHAKVKKMDEDSSTFMAEGKCGDKLIVKARFSLRHFNLADKDPGKAKIDSQVVENLKKRWQLLCKQ
ncbi:3-hydroxyacyl-[acyl-carrier-protein] dehydratase FabZ [Anaerohalosphaera lusitana]|uniref:3-hydroxyacyl-[acyl-carrier-protein] dehydratase FabZ n=1 Tax=Anaerohalosphaera lusitana TaxID=1936003 RepID=A0A1U9NM88_9BACT|nr:hypothetical protein [Anaerohalosphaera lusitana]AQT68838.1 3-hydroxyacyl-[acyl-carrier-protein] dehydratase FabZ [Anaerohalosphaera lusitana]